MKENEFTCIRGRRIILVPYEKKHVPKYNEWMQSEELQIQTGSEPLTLEQEYDMQKTWREDEAKCTFILLDADMFETSGHNEIDSMIGDVNIFVGCEEGQKTGEISLMVAEKGARRKGFGKEVLNLIMRYGKECPILSIQQFTAKISYTNQPSINLFTKAGFTEVSRSDVFQEITFQLTCTNEVYQKLVTDCPDYRMCDYQNLGCQ